MTMRVAVTFGLLVALTVWGTAQPAKPEPKSEPVQAKEVTFSTPTDSANIPAEPNAAQFGLYLPRTMAMLKASEQGDPTPIRILFYGQSIAAQQKVQSTILDELSKAYPKARLVRIDNTIGGYEAHELVRTMTHDVVPARPDLIIFHDYKGEEDGTYEEIIRFMRCHTTADILMWDHHFDLYAPDAARDSQGEFRRSIAAKYRCEFVALRSVWKEYHQRHNLPRNALLSDGVHNNPAGCEIMGRIIARHFVPNRDAQPTAAVTSVNLAGKDLSKDTNVAVRFDGPMTVRDDGAIELAPGSKLEVDFVGNRVDAIGPVDAGDASAKILVDGKSPSTIPSLWATTRPSRTVSGWFPGVNRISPTDVAMVREDWTLHCFDVSKDGLPFKFRLVGSVTGPDGEGSSADSVFVSNSGRLRIEPKDFSLKRTYKSLKKDGPPECDIKFKSFPLCLDEYQRIGGDAKTDGARQTLLLGLSNQKHRLTIISDGPQPLPIQSLTVYRPVFNPDSSRSEGD